MVPRTILPTMMLQPRVKDFQVRKVLRGIIVGAGSRSNPCGSRFATVASLGHEEKPIRWGLEVGTCQLPQRRWIYARTGRWRSWFALSARLQRQAATTRIGSEEEGDLFSAYGGAGDFGFRLPAKSPITAGDSGVRRPPPARQQMRSASRPGRARPTSPAAYLPPLRI